MANDNQNWKDKLSPDQFYVTRMKGTEKPFSSELLKCNKEGKYLCLCCGTELFPSETKFDSHCGWPAFYAASKNEESIVRTEDLSHGMHRVEVTCKNCGAHLGHVFNDGPRPTGERFCINGISLKFQPK